MGLDPIVVMGLATAAFGALGWLLGPVVGNGVWNAVYRKYRGGFEVVSPLALALSGTLPIDDILTGNVCNRRRKSSTLALEDIVSIPRRTRSRTQYPTSTARRSQAWLGIGIG